MAQVHGYILIWTLPHLLPQLYLPTVPPHIVELFYPSSSGSLTPEEPQLEYFEVDLQKSSQELVKEPGVVLV